MTEQETFYVTFGSQYRHEPHPWPVAHPDGWLTVTAPSELAARAGVHEVMGPAWSMIYDAEDWARDENSRARWYPRGELGTLRLVGDEWTIDPPVREEPTMNSLRVDPQRVQYDDATGVYCRATLNGKWMSVDMATLDEASLEVFVDEMTTRNPDAAKRMLLAAMRGMTQMVGPADTKRMTEDLRRAGMLDS